MTGFASLSLVDAGYYGKGSIDLLSVQSNLIHIKGIYFTSYAFYLAPYLTNWYAFIFCVSSEISF
jgi:hypothetical protein